MAITNFIPEVWASTLLASLQKSLVYGGSPCVNTDYEGSISAFGDTVHITAVGDVTISDYAKDTDLTVQTLDDTGQTLTIDQAKAFAFEVDDIDTRQSANGGALMAGAAQNAAYALADATDQYVAGLMKAGVSAHIDGGTNAIAVSADTDAYNSVLVPLSVQLDENNVPSQGRWVIVSPSFYGKLLLDSRFIKANEAGTDEGLRNGNVGTAAGFTIFKSNNVPAGTIASTQCILAGTSIATSFADQISKVEAFRPEKRFADALKGLHLYGAKVVQDAALISADVTVS